MDPNLVLRMLLRGLLIRHLQQMEYLPHFPRRLRGVDLQGNDFIGAVQDAIDDTVDTVANTVNIHTMNEADIVDDMINNVILWVQIRAEEERLIREIPSHHYHTGGRRHSTKTKKHIKSRKNKN